MLLELETPRKLFYNTQGRIQDFSIVPQVVFNTTAPYYCSSLNVILINRCASFARRCYYPRDDMLTTSTWLFQKA
jgi:hypothetical protein